MPDQPLTPLTLGGRLDEPMVLMEDSPTVAMPAYADPPVLKWETRHEYHLAWSAASLHAFAHVVEFRAFPDRPADRPWHAYCCGPRVPGPEPAEFSGWFSTAEAGIAAVETHIAERVEEHLAGLEASQ